VVTSYVGTAIFCPGARLIGTESESFRIRTGLYSIRVTVVPASTFIAELPRICGMILYTKSGADPVRLREIGIAHILDMTGGATAP